MVRALEEIDHAENLSIAPDRLAQFKKETSSNKTMQKIIVAVKYGWPTTKRQCNKDLIPYYDKRSELVVNHGLVFAGERLVVPTSLRKHMLKQIHQSHMGIEGCLRRVREVLYWPRINAEVKDFVSKCPTCQAQQPEQCREELKPYPISFRPWETVSIDLFELGKQQFVLFVDHWSGFFEVQELTWTTADKVITASKVQFARHGISDMVIGNFRFATATRFYYDYWIIFSH